MVNVSNNMADLEKAIYEKYRNAFPFPVFEYANEIGITVYADSSMPSMVSGAISQDNGKYEIILNAKHSLNRMRFTLAHELSHYFNDKEYLSSVGEIQDSSKQACKKWLFRDDGTCSDREMRGRDVYANQFAAELLMPEEVFVEKWQECTSVEQVAEYFGVSADAARIRASVLLGEIV
jgi:Zn-dependent peptidase ImmA (M78 family)